MAVVKSDTRYIGGKHYRRKFKCGANGEFSVNFPRFAADVLGCGTSFTGTTMAEIDKTWTAKALEYETAKTSTDKVILYQFNRSGTVWNPERTEVLLNANAGENDISFTNGLALDVWYLVCWERKTSKVDGPDHYSYVDENGSRLSTHADVKCHTDYDTGRAEKENRLEWTESREAFFKHVESALSALILNLADLQKNQSKLVEHADNQLALPGPAQLPKKKKVRKKKKG